MPTAGKLAATLLMAVAASACSIGGSDNQARHTSPPVTTASAHLSPSPTANPAPQPVTGSYGVLYSSQAASTYTVSIIGIDAKVLASASASTPPTPSCGNVAAALVAPPVSMSDSRVYFMDASGAVHWLAPDGRKDQSPVATLPAPTATRRSMFAVSPDDAQMAVVVDDFTATGAATQLYTIDLNSDTVLAHLFNESGSSTLWPIGWHGTNNLVLGKISSCTQGGGPFVGTPTELHVVDPGTANRRFTIGSSTCPPVNRPSPAGVVCETPPNATVLSWTATTIHTYPIAGPVGAYLSPGGGNVAFVDNTGTKFTGGGSPIPNVFICAWLDDTHVMSGGDAQHQPRVVDISSNVQVPIPAQGDCAGRLPGSL